MDLLISEKNKIYKAALKFAEEDILNHHYAFGLCFCIRRAIRDRKDFNFINPYDKGLIKFPELYRHKPKHITSKDEYWFKPCYESSIKRISILKQAIIETSEN